ncbi:putative bifunctional diguanylate cyclase/phosphodiesterase [Alteraurantiacibacter aquimixticola]|uniref:putative bifunctional diguanylate cyclase/phosphodiesterase n=1 Tax=Alteraurantiacibacter aquimixticola TaxID=2489173 RepID=UPI001FE70D41|nr:EAL domain-containing protein [Alteraurantiacibacter aquimixticola]
MTGAACGVIVGSVAANSTSQPLLFWIAMTLIVLACTRALTAIGAKSWHNAAGDFLRRTYWIGALLYAAAAGAAGGTSLMLAEDPHVSILLVGFALIFGAGIAVGNAGRPAIAFSQMALTFLPIVAGCLVVGTAPLLALAVILPALKVGLVVLTLGIFTTLSKEVEAARQSRQLAHEMREQARTDGITKLANRTGFEVAGKALLERADPEAQVALIWLDLHRFKEVNDMLGHTMGDQVLCETAKRLRRRAPEGALIARFGSDEFLILASLASRRAVDALVSEINSDLASPMRIGGHRIESGASIGVGLAGPSARTLDPLMHQAGLALYHAKIAGRHQICFFNSAMTRNLVRKKEIEAELRAAIQKDELSIYFQPIVDLATGRIRAFEALVRWFHPERGELVPEEFIPVAEDTGLIITLGNWITRQAALTAAQWPKHIKLAVNLSPVQIRAPGAALGILKALEDAGIHPSRLELEVTENLFVEDNAETALFMEELAAQGVRFALDDFGTGYSSLHYINKYPFRTIKVDRSFVSGPKTGRKSDAIIRAVAEMGNTLGMEIVAEGLETAEQVQVVRAAGCTLGQGYHFSRAVPEHLARLLLAEEELLDTGTRLAG